MSRFEWFNVEQRSSTARVFRPQLELLEDRCVPALIATFNGGTEALKVTVNNDSTTEQRVIFYVDDGYVCLTNSCDIQGGSVKASDVRSIVVIGSDLDNRIDLSGVTTASFLGLDGRITVKAGIGNDTIYGSAFADVLEGEKGHDYLSGDDGADKIRGGRGNDTLVGELGDDSLYGGRGDDRLWGGSGKDYFDGGDGYDAIFDFERCRNEKSNRIERKSFSC
jgi:Ca2+-binding RTX toxin-like protein